MTHDCGPWKIESRSGGVCRVGTLACPAMIAVGGRGHDHAMANAKRIVQCLNACEGIPSTELIKMVRAWKADKTAFTCRGRRKDKTAATG